MLDKLETTCGQICQISCKEKKNTRRISCAALIYTYIYKEKTKEIKCFQYELPFC